MSDEADRWRSERRPSSHFPAPASGQLGEGDGSDTPTMRRLRQAAATQEAAAQRALAEAREEGGAQVRELIAEVRLLRDEGEGRRAARAAEDDVRGGPQSRADALMRSEAVRAAEQRAAEVGARLRHVEAESSRASPPSRTSSARCARRTVSSSGGCRRARRRRRRRRRPSTTTSTRPSRTSAPRRSTPVAGCSTKRRITAGAR